MSGITWLVENGYEVHEVRTFDYDKFAMKESGYLIDRYGDENRSKQIKNE